MAANNYMIRGEAFYAKVLGRPVPNFGKDGFEWTIEIKPDKAGMKTLKDLGVADRVTKGENKDRILFRQRQTRQNGDENKPITVVAEDGKTAWPQDKLIGNGSVVDLKFNFQDYGKGKRAGLYPQAIRVLEHVPYERVEFAPLNEEDEFFRKPEEDEELNDDFDDVV